MRMVGISQANTIILFMSKKKSLCLGTELHSQRQITRVCGNNRWPILSGGITDDTDPSTFGGEEGGGEMIRWSSDLASVQEQTKITSMQI